MASRRVQPTGHSKSKSHSMCSLGGVESLSRWMVDVTSVKRRKDGCGFGDDNDFVPLRWHLERPEPSADDAREGAFRWKCLGGGVIVVGIQDRNGIHGLDGLVNRCVRGYYRRVHELTYPLIKIRIFMSLHTSVLLTATRLGFAVIVEDIFIWMHLL